MIRPRNKAVVMLLVLVCLLSACGGGKKKVATETTVVSEPAPRAQYTWPPVLSTVSKQDQSYLALIAVRQAEVPTTWTVINPASSFDPRETNEDEAFVQCLFGTNPSPLTGYFAGPVYLSSDTQTTYKSFVRSVESKSAGASDFKSLTADRVAACQTSMYELEQSPPGGQAITGAKFGNAEPLKMPVDTIASPEGSKDVRAYRMIIAPQDKSAIHQDLLAYGAGRYEVVVLIESATNPDEALEKSVITNVKARTLVAAEQG